MALGLALRGVAHAALDLSDGLAGDLLHILKRSNVRATVDIDQCRARHARRAARNRRSGTASLAGGDDYELCFTAPVAARAEIERISERRRKFR